MSEQKTLTKEQVIDRIAFLSEMITLKTNQLNALVENLKRFDGYSTGSKEIAEKVELHIKKQQVEVAGLVQQQQIAPGIGELIGRVLLSTGQFVKNTCSDAEKLFYSKQGEVLNFKSEVESLLNLKGKYENYVAQLEQKEKVEEVTLVQEVVEQQKTKKVRPDKDPTTKIGRAAMDVMERKKKSRAKSP